MSNFDGMIPVNPNVQIDAGQAYEHIGGNRAMAMIGGAVLFSKGDDRLTVKVAAKNSAKITAFVVILMADDTYAVQFYKGRGINMRLDATLDLEGLHADQLRRALESRTGLYFRL